ncbi:outer membrane protein assembly factor BamB family protein [Mucilaginibacter boryungensis]|uniref:PQQ-binding-like beta-propeller repeat protein n=1 Tax=Mucilaginibacter boryungensis TaxID=768480 RepID=A0ABR9XG50_9SPHI|nr:PQQ-binding-like beta-propeller repeat protein [Mucilaginibacter boryungensis]MBE9666157.1 PQQ-binding-like beta-propeller repeat protein [Mucilaginibacter boryungensis]
MYNTCRFLVVFMLFSTALYAQDKSWKFAHISDTHIGNETSVEDLRRTVRDINANPDIQFAVISGDITEFGADEELRTAKNILDSLNKPWYIVPGNHDMNWSENGGNSFKKIFGSETFATKQHGYLFIGINCGPNMRMSPGQVPRENLVWLDSVLKATPKETPIIFVNHYPQDSSLNNWYEIVDRLKTHNIQLVICGHGHNNHHLNFEGIPGIMGRSNLRAKDPVGGYNIVTIAADSVYYNERTPGVATKPVWTKDRLYNHHFKPESKYKRPGYAVNQQFNNVQTLWRIQDDSDIGAGTTIVGDKVIVVNTAGRIKAYALTTGKQVWATKAGGKIYSTPCAADNFIVVACTDDYLYCLDKNTGRINWKAVSGKPIVASPVIKDGRVFCGSSDGHFKCYDLKTGKVNWDFAAVKGFVETRPLLYNGNVYFGSWGNHFYALNQKTGAVLWDWTNGSTNRMFSPASCEPVATGNRLFIVAPDRYMTCIDAITGKQLWRKQDPKIRVRESMGISTDSTLVYAKTMEGDVVGFDTKADSMSVKWQGSKNMGYDISPTLIKEQGGLVFATSNSGAILAFNRADGSLAWVHKISNALVNPLSFVNDHQLVATTMDGVIVCLKY